MKKSIKAALFSALVLPGAGHFLLKQYIQAILLAGIASTATFHVIAVSVEKALQILEKIEHGDVQPDVFAITALLEKQGTGAEAQLLDIATLSIVICWLIGIIDSYRIGHMQDKNNRL